MRGLILAAGTGSRLHPLTKGVSKHLLPVHNKPMIYYPLTTLILSGVTEIAIVVNSDDLGPYSKTLGDGSAFGVSIEYFVQAKPMGLPDGIAAAKDFIEDQRIAVILGDNIIFGPGFGESLARLQGFDGGALAFAQHVQEPQRFGVVSFDGDKVIGIEEKPVAPKSNLAVLGFYVFDESVLSRISDLSISSRGETEIVEVLGSYLATSTLSIEKLPRSVSWLDAGTIASLAQASEFIRAIEDRTGRLVGSPEEAALILELIGHKELEEAARAYPQSQYVAKLGSEN